MRNLLLAVSTGGKIHELFSYAVYHLLFGSRVRNKDKGCVYIQSSHTEMVQGGAEISVNSEKVAPEADLQTF